MRWIALAIAVYAIIEWANMYAPMYQWIQDLPTWLGHILFGMMFLAAVAGALNYRHHHRAVNRNQAVDSDGPSQE